MTTSARCGSTLGSVVFTAAMALAAPADAEGDCPPGAFCEPAPAQPRAAQKQQSDTAEAGENGSEAKGSTREHGSLTVVLPPSSSVEPQVVVVKQRPGEEPPEVIAYAPRADLPLSPGHHPPKQRGALRLGRLGLQIRGTGLVLPKLRDDVARPKMGGAGASLRYRPIAPIVLDAGLDVLAGYDSNGFARREVPLTFSMLLYLFPRSVAAPYVLVGVNGTFARVESQNPQLSLAQGTSARYTYVGGHAGAGIEFRLTRAFSLSLDGVAFVRERVDENAKKYPEIIDRDTGLGSNTSVGGHVRGGLTYWW